MTFQNWLIAFCLTQLFEMPIYFLVFRRESWPKRFLYSFGASAITHPLVWGAFLWHDLPHEVNFVMAETFAISAEAVYLQFLGIRRALYWSLVANLTSILLGQLYYSLKSHSFSIQAFLKAMTS